MTDYKSAYKHSTRTLRVETLEDGASVTINIPSECLNRLIKISEESALSAALDLVGRQNVDEFKANRDWCSGVSDTELLVRAATALRTLELRRENLDKKLEEDALALYNLACPDWVATEFPSEAIRGNWVRHLLALRKGEER